MASGCKMTPENRIISDPLRQQFVDILAKNRITKEIEKIILTEPQDLKGQHFGADIGYLKIYFKDGNQQNLFVKMLGNLVTSQWAKDMKFMDKEAEFYTVLLPQLKEFCLKYKASEDFLNFFPKCFHANEEMIVLDNLVLNGGYIMLDNDIKHDLLTAKIVLEHLAKFHAVNYAFILEEFEGVEKFGNNPKWALVCQESLLPENSPMIKGMYEDPLRICINILKKNSTFDRKEAVQIFESYIKQTNEKIKSYIGFNPENLFQVINHGDFKNKNMLFQKQNEEFMRVMFVDLQLTRFGSPTLDIGYYLWTSVESQVRAANLEDLLCSYFQKFEEILKTFGKTIPISFDQFYDDYRIHSDLGWILKLNHLTMGGVMKEIEVESFSSDLEEMNNQWTAAIEDWICKNPEKMEEIALEILDLVREREILQGRK